MLTLCLLPRPLILSLFLFPLFFPLPPLLSPFFPEVPYTSLKPYTDLVFSSHVPSCGSPPPPNHHHCIPPAYTSVCYPSSYAFWLWSLWCLPLGKTQTLWGLTVWVLTISYMYVSWQTMKLTLTNIHISHSNLCCVLDQFDQFSGFEFNHSQS